MTHSTEHGVVTPEVIVVAGARPNFMKVAPLCRAFAVDGRMRVRLVHTGQHYDPVLSDQIMRDLELPPPDDHLEVGSAAPSLQTAKILEAMDRMLVERPPLAVLVVGDVTSTVAAGLAAANRSVPLIHVEAGLRSRDWTMPEERNRVVVDRLSQLLFVTEPSGVDNLRDEGVAAGVHLVGNTMIDSLLQILPRARESGIRERLGLADQRYSVMTLHRPGNVDQSAAFAKMIEALAPLAEEAPLVFPVHPRTKAQVEALHVPEGLRCIAPLGYTEFIGLVEQASLTLTDSGGLQEETTVLGVPCLTLRPNTERPITVEIGSNELVYNDAEKIRTLGMKALRGEWKPHRVPELWDGQAASRIVSVIGESLLR
ncbi:MAG: UDP-N-acetylglucosamine 2-epimerase (non-hydrolyzing) [Planctomycetes bacterium]|nr:UDP-N-acetylglucosamine 2-epimerase (non-hydrolyzing) [Planctomycetota bacterium]